MEPFVANDVYLLFLHGVGDGDPDDLWRSALTDTLERLSYPSLHTVHVVAPKYAHALKGTDDRQSLPPVTVKDLSREAARTNRREFERRMGAVEFRLGRHNAGNSLPPYDVAVGASVALPQFQQARKYLTDPQVRAQVLKRILEALPVAGRIVIVGHSLGSVIAADLLRRLPVSIEVAGMITIGSPLANASFEVDTLRDSLKEPPANLGWWVSFWNVFDPVAAHRGVSSAFPWMIDFRIKTGKILRQAHAAVDYLGDDSVVAAIGFALFGSKSTDVARVDQGTDMPLDSAELLAVLALRYAYLMNTTLKGEERERFNGALRQVQASTFRETRERNLSAGREMPSAIAQLAFDFSDPHATVPEPRPNRYLTREEAIVPFTILAAENVIRPFEISISRAKWQPALSSLGAEMGLGSEFGKQVFAAAKTAEEALKRASSAKWIKLGALGVGAAAIVVATGGLALGAGAGLAGAAAVTSALAGFGPGGMIGGLLTAGTLVSAGGGGIAFGLASPGTSAQALEAVVERRLAAEILRAELKFDSDPGVWRVLTEIEMEVRREYERLDEFSDESSPALKELRNKVETVEHALKYLSDNGLEPGATDAEPETAIESSK